MDSGDPRAENGTRNGAARRPAAKPAAKRTTKSATSGTRKAKPAAVAVAEPLVEDVRTGDSPIDNTGGTSRGSSGHGKKQQPTGRSDARSAGNGSAGNGTAAKPTSNGHAAPAEATDVSVESDTVDGDAVADVVAEHSESFAVPDATPVPVPTVESLVIVPAVQPADAEGDTERVEPSVFPAPTALDTGVMATAVFDATVLERPVLDIPLDPATDQLAAQPTGKPARSVIGRRRRPRVRRVTRVVRHVDTWSVFKVALVFNVFLYAVCLTAGVLLWQVAQGTDTIGNIEKWFESFGWSEFELKGGEIYHNAWIGGLFVVVGLTGFAVLMATLFNLITDLVGGIRVSVLEEEVLSRPERGVPLLRQPAQLPDPIAPVTSQPDVLVRRIDDTNSPQRG